MSKLAAAITANQPRHGLPCAVATLIDSIKAKADRAELLAAIADKRVNHSALDAAITDVYKVQLPTGSLAKHRNGRCRCRRG